MPLTPPPPPLRLTSRPLLVAAVALAVGIVAARLAPAGPGAFLAGITALAVAAGTYGLASRHRLVTLRGLAVAAVVLGGTAGLGAARLAAFETPRADSLDAAARSASAEAETVRGRDADTAEPITLWARVASVPVASAWSVRFTARTDSAERGDVRGPARSLVQVSLDVPGAPAWGGPVPAQPVYPALHVGDRVRLTGALLAPPTRRNPADFDYGAHLRRQGVAATLRVEAADGVVFLAPARGVLHRLAFGVQRHVRRAVARHVPGPDAQAVALALLVSDWSRLETSTVEAFRETGLLHLLSVSGLHLVFVGLALYGLLGPLLRRTRVPRRTAEWTRALVTVAVMFVYVVAAGAGAPVVRAFVMASVLVVGRASERRVDTLNGLGLAALVVLLWRPTALFDAGFQLSFGAVAALVAATPTLTAWLPAAWTRAGVPKAVTSSLVASTVATLASTPVLLATFGRLPLAGVVLNLPAIPLTSGALGASLGAVLCAGWWPAGADLFGAAASACVDALLWTTALGAEGLAAWTVEAFVTGPSMLAALAMPVLVLAFWTRRGARASLALGAVACLALGAWTGVARGDDRPVLDAVFLDVGQGDATLLRFPGGHAVLVDAGERTDRRDEGLRTVVPHLARYGVRRLDAVVATHPHADHIGGIAAVLRAVPVGRLITNGQAGDAMWAETQRLADSLGVPEQAVTAGDTLDFGPSVRVRVLGPSQALAAAGGTNEASVVLLVEYGATRWVLAGDAETAAEAEIVAHYARLLRADVVKVGHHGSRTSSSLAFVAAASGVAPGASLVSARTQRRSTPRYAVVSVARRNRHGLPDEEPVMRWLVAGASVLQTADEGAVWLKSDGETVERVNWRQRSDLN